MSVYRNAELCDLITLQLLVLGVSIMSYMTSLSIDINVHDQETCDHQLTNEPVSRALPGTWLLYITRVLKFPLSTVIA